MPNRRKATIVRLVMNCNKLTTYVKNGFSNKQSEMRCLFLSAMPVVGGGQTLKPGHKKKLTLLHLVMMTRYLPNVNGKILTLILTSCMKSNEKVNCLVMKISIYISLQKMFTERLLRAEYEHSLVKLFTLQDMLDSIR